MMDTLDRVDAKYHAVYLELIRQRRTLVGIKEILDLFVHLNGAAARLGIPVKEEQRDSP